MPDRPALDQIVTRFGAAWAPAPRAVAVLRARAGRFGLGDGRCSTVDAVAAAIAADAWMTALGTDTLDRPGRHGAHATAALGAVLSRAVGSPCDPLSPLPAAPACDDWLVTAEFYRQVAEELTGADATDTLTRAASDLSHGSSDDRLATMAALLETVADLPDGY